MPWLLGLALLISLKQKTKQRRLFENEKFQYLSPASPLKGNISSSVLCLSFNHFLSPLRSIILCSSRFTSGRGRFTTEALSIQLSQRTDDRKRNGYSFWKGFSLMRATGLLQSAERIGQPSSAALACAAEVKRKVNIE